MHLEWDSGQTLLGGDRAHQGEHKSTKEHMEIVSRIRNMELQRKLVSKRLLGNLINCLGKIECVEIGHWSLEWLESCQPLSFENFQYHWLQIECKENTYDWLWHRHCVLGQELVIASKGSSRF